MRGFSLVELSIVLVILGLLTGGILSGQSLIRASELRSVTTDISNYTAAIHSFRDKYFATPGDMSTATNFWGAKDAGDGLGVDCTNLYASSTATCNGNGDGTVTGTWPEAYNAWHHLANAGLITGQYTGRAGTVNALHATPGVNTPASKLSNGLYFLSTLSHAGDGGHFAMDYGLNLHLTQVDQTTTSDIYILNAEEAWNIDTKFDDGKPGLGKVIASANINNVTSCITATTSTDFTSDYRLTIKNPCATLFFRNIQ